MSSPYRRGSLEVAAAALALVYPTCATAQTLCFTVLTDKTTPIYAFGDTPALWGDTAAFLAQSKSTLLDGIYRMPADLSAPSDLVANELTVVPNESILTYFHSLQNPAVRDGAVTFTGGNTNNADGLYYQAGNAPVITLVDAHGGFPSPYPRPSMGADGVAFVAKSGFEVPWFVEYVNPTPAKVYSNGQAAPGGGTFIKTEPGIPAMGNHVMAFTALCNKPGGTAGGAYTWNSLTNQISLAANWNTPMPSLGGLFFDYFWAIDTDDATVALVGKNGFIGFGGRVGLYTGLVGAAGLSTVAVDGDPAPSGQPMTNFGSVAVEGDLLVFMASFGNPVAPTGIGLMGRFDGGPVFEILKTGDLFEGRQVLGIDFSHRALSGHRILFRVALADPGVPGGSYYSVVAADLDPLPLTCPEPPPPGSNEIPAPLGNCATWTGMSAPDAPMPISIRGIEVIAADDIWVVGAGSYAAHFDGEIWTTTPAPTVDGHPIAFEDVSASGPDDVWASGYAGVGGDVVAATARWDGKSWSLVPMPAVHPTKNWIFDVEAIAPNDVYACGYQGDATTFLLMHFDGSTWTSVHLPTVGPTLYQELWSVTATGPNDVYAAGAALPPGDDWEATIFHFDGVAWTKLADVPQPESSPTIYDIVAIAPDLIWAVGDMFVADAGHQTMTMRYDGVSWQHVPSPNPGAGWDFLFGVAGTDAGHVVACGYHYYGAVNEPIALAWDPAESIWRGYDLPMVGYSTDAWAAGALPSGEGIIAGGIGYYGGTPADAYLKVFRKPGGVADLDCDGRVNSADLAMLLGEWGVSGSAADLDGDGSVGSADLATLLGEWTG